jgi:tetratricopeptide (TPR) repeat protein
MTKNIITTLVIFLLAASLGFTSCKQIGKTVATDNLINDSAVISGPDSAANRAAMADSSWDNAAEAFAKVKPDSQDTLINSSKKPAPNSKMIPITMQNPLRPQELTDGLNKAKNGDLRGAITDFDRCIEKNNKNYYAYFYKAKALLELKDPENALKNLDLAIDNNTANAMFYYYRGKLLFESGNREKAYPDFETAKKFLGEYCARTHQKDRRRHSGKYGIKPNSH